LNGPAAPAWSLSSGKAPRKAWYRFSGKNPPPSEPLTTAQTPPPQLADLFIFNIHHLQSTSHSPMKSTAVISNIHAELISPEEAAKWTRGASNAGYHYLGCAKTYALMGKAFADANLEMMKGRNDP
jgi:hypothetical protein